MPAIIYDSKYIRVSEWLVSLISWQAKVAQLAPHYNWRSLKRSKSKWILLRSSIKSGVVRATFHIKTEFTASNCCLAQVFFLFNAHRRTVNNFFAYISAATMNDPIVTMSDNGSATKVDSSSLAEILSLVNSATSAATKKRLAARSWELYIRQLGDCPDDDFVAPPRELLLYLVR